MLPRHIHTLVAAAGHRRYLLFPVTSTVVGTIGSAAGYWGLQLTGWAAVLPLVVGIVVAFGVVVWWLLSYATKLRLEAEPKIRLTFSSEEYPHVQVLVDSNGAQFRCYSAKIENVGQKTLSVCKAEIESARDHDGNQVVTMPFPLKRGEKHDETFTLLVGDTTFVDIVAVPVAQDGPAIFAQCGRVSWPSPTKNTAEAWIRLRPTEIIFRVVSDAPVARMKLELAAGKDGAYKPQRGSECPVANT